MQEENSVMEDSSGFTNGSVSERMSIYTIQRTFCRHQRARMFNVTDRATLNGILERTDAYD